MTAPGTVDASPAIRLTELNQRAAALRATLRVTTDRQIREHIAAELVAVASETETVQADRDLLRSALVARCLHNAARAPHRTVAAAPPPPAEDADDEDNLRPDRWWDR